MKKVLLILGLAISTLSFGQKKGDKFVSGTVSYTKTTDVDGIYTINPTLGLYLTDKVSVGILGEVGKNGTEETVNVGAFGRCDFMTIGKCLTAFSQLEVLSNSSKVSDVKTTGLNANLGLGVNCSISKKLSLTMNVADLVSYEKIGDVSTTTIGFTGINNPFATGKVGLLYRF